MKSRRITLDTAMLPDPKRMEWMEANGIDPWKVPASQEVLVEDGKLTFVEFVLDPSGFKKLDADCKPERILRTVPLVSAPENHGL